ncbi:hypothetical protein [Actinoplanes awajinensis]|uniref:hypothetical protein n=1 Tax=Actinoplanes awajinensis TaxID=135946 RepID=UPI0009FF8683|nr:hypothetical protein [Actinoplanes awajinensis]
MDDSFPDPFLDQAHWGLEPPRPIAPVPATMSGQLRGRRVLIGLPGLGWRGDLRADEKVVQGSRTYIPVMPESEWYRAEAEQTEVFAALIPIDRVWVEDLGVAGLPGVTSQAKPQLVSLDEPPRRSPIPAEQASSLTGRRIARLLDDGGEQRDLRATTELYSSESGEVCARVATELEWYRWSWNGRLPQTLEVPANLLWVE